VIGIAFALRGTLTAAAPFEREAFVELVCERRAAAGLPFRAAEIEAAADDLFGAPNQAIPSPARLAEAATRLVGEASALPALIARFRHIAAGNASRSVTCSPGTRKTLERIESLGIPAAVLCNGWSRIAQAEAACTGFTGDVLVSEDIGLEEPAPEAYRALAASIGLPPDRIWYVGNDPRRHIHGAAAAGLSAVWLNESGAAYPPGLAPPARTIARFEDVLPPLCEEYTRSLLSLRNLMRSGLHWRQGHYVPAPPQRPDPLDPEESG
jgi:FMN phosphatase YigB (HAD superfamily)